MTSNPMLKDTVRPLSTRTRADRPAAVGHILRDACSPLASLRLTVVLFALAIFIILVGTLAQTENDIREVLQQYFHPWLAHIKISVFFPAAWFPDLAPAAMRLAFALMGFSATAVAAALLYAMTPVRQAATGVAAAAAVFGCLTTISGMSLGAFWFPGGALIGLAMAVNLLAAHGLRFRVEAAGTRLWAGSGIVAVGVFITWLIIAGGHNENGLQAEPIVSYALLWQIFKVVLSVVWLAAAATAVVLAGRGWFRHVEYWVFPVLLILVGTVVAWMWFGGQEAYLGDSGMRILWQLIQASVAGLVLLAGCMLIFKRRGGIVLIHGGIGLLMLSELLVTKYAVEGQMPIDEGRTTNFLQDIRAVELAVVDKSAADVDTEVVIPENLLTSERPIEHELLPVGVRVERYIPNTQLNSQGVLPTVREVGSGFDNPATAGAGRAYAASPARIATGTDTNQGVDQASAYVTFYEKSGNASLGTYLLSQLLKDQTIQVGDKVYDLSLRFKRLYRPYRIRLIDVRKDDYLGTSTPRNYSSDIQLIDPTRNENRETKISMNNPLRYAGETFYQSSYNRDRFGNESTVLQVVTNAGWMIPYVACMLVATGLLAHFGAILLRFLRRRAANDRAVWAEAVYSEVRDPGQTEGNATVAPNKERGQPTALVFPALLVVLAAAWVLLTLRPAVDPQGALAMQEAGRAPVVYQGRVKPLDTLARNSLRIISEKETFARAMDRQQLKANWDTIAQSVRKNWPKVTAADVESPNYDVNQLVELVVRKTGSTRADVEPVVDKLTTRSEPAIFWLLDVISHAENAERHKVFRIENFELQDTLRLPRRKRYRYAFGEISPRLDAFKDQVRRARAIDRSQLTTYQRRVLGLDAKIELYFALREAYRLPEVPPEKADLDQQMKTISLAAELADSGAPRAISTGQDQRSWEPLATAAAANWVRQLARQKETPTAHELAVRLSDEFFTAEQTDSLVQTRIQGMIEEILQSRDPSLTGDALRERAEQVVQNMPEHIRETIEPAARQFVEQRQSGFTDQLTAILTRLCQGSRLDTDENSTAVALAAALRAYRDGDVETFNRELNAYEMALQQASPEELRTGDSLIGRVIANVFGGSYQFEAYFNHAGAFGTAYVLYLVAFLLAVLAWLGWSRPLNRAAFWLIVLTFLLHTAALVARVYISGRPPVTNLYSSAIFIGWGCVVLGIVLELFFRLGIGNLVASVTGFATLGVAYQLAADGDTFVVMQAVLDTQFWLATHVVCVTLGYATTFLAGGLGVAYIVLGVLTPRLTAQLAKELSRMIYGTLCFAIFFSFVGTVLGGLWADDSWGRFWGWDPKENGAMIIVLWVALVLHARWGGIVKQRGLAMLAVAGNIATSWSWFGVNELGVGLHSYGFTEGVLLGLALFVTSQMAIIGLGLVPPRLWVCNSASRNALSAPAA